MATRKKSIGKKREIVFKSKEEIIKAVEDHILIDLEFFIETGSLDNIEEAADDFSFYAADINNNDIIKNFIKSILTYKK